MATPLLIGTNSPRRAARRGGFALSSKVVCSLVTAVGVEALAKWQAAVAVVKLASQWTKEVWSRKQWASMARRRRSPFFAFFAARPHC